MQEMETKLLEKLKASIALEVDAAVEKQTRGLEAVAAEVEAVIAEQAPRVRRG
jgi:hypothetical protein